MHKDPGGGAEDQESESRRTGSAQPKKPLAEFLAEFEQRLLDHPEESATSALQVVEDRAGGRRRSAAGPGATTPRPVPQNSVPRPSATAPPVPNLSPPPAAPLPGTLATSGPPEASAEAEGPAAVGDSEPPGAAAETRAETRRLRGRRRRRHRHRAH